MRQIWAVLRREYLERVKTKVFIISTLLVPLLMLGGVVLTVFLGTRAAQSNREMVLLDYTGLFGEQVVERMNQAGYDTQLADVTEGTEHLDRQIIEEELEAYIVLDDLTAQEGSFVYKAGEPPGRVRGGFIRGVVVETVMEERLARLDDATGLRELIAGGDIAFEFVGEDSEEGETAMVRRYVALGVGFAGTFFLYMGIILYGSFVMRSVLDEKRNRVVEVVISSIRPTQLMLGKILGVGSVGLTQVGIWVSCGLLLSLMVLPMVAAEVPDFNFAEFRELLPGPGAFILLLVYFLFGYFLYSSLFAAVGAMCSREEDAGQLQAPLVIMLIFPLIIQSMTIEGGANMPWMDWAALFPFFSPLMMYPRAISGQVEWWMVALSLVLMLLALLGTTWVASRIYRIGILMQGKRPTMREMLRWVRAG